MSQPEVTRIQLLTDTTENLQETSVAPMRGEPIVFQDGNKTVLKIGDGTNSANDLPNLDLGTTTATSITFGTATLNKDNVSNLVALANAVYANGEVKF